MEFRLTEFRFHSFPLRKIFKASISVTFPLIALCFHVNPRLHTHQYSVCAWPALNVHMHFRSEAAPPPAKLQRHRLWRRRSFTAETLFTFSFFTFCFFIFYFSTFYFILFLTSFLFVCLHFGVYIPVRHNISINVIG